MNCELPDAQASFRKAEEPEIKLPSSAGSSRKQESSRKTPISALLTMPKPLTVWIRINCGKFWKRWEYQTTLPAFWETCTEVKKQQLELVTPTSAYTQSHNRPGRTLSHCILVASMALTHTTCCTQLPPLRDWGHCSIQGCHRPVEARGRHPHEAWNHRLVLNQESSTSRLYIVTLLI